MNLLSILYEIDSLKDKIFEYFNCKCYINYPIVNLTSHYWSCSGHKHGKEFRLALDQKFECGCIYTSLFFKEENWVLVLSLNNESWYLLDANKFIPWENF